MIHQIMFASTLSANTDRALDRACMIAEASGAPLLVVHAIDPGVLPERYVFATMDRARAALEQELDDAACCDEIHTEIDVLLGTPDEALVEHAGAVNADLLVIGSSRSSSLSGTVWGTTVEQVLRKSPCPVLVVKRRPGADYRHVVVALDLQDASRHAFDFALRAFPSARVTVLHADASARDLRTGRSDIETPVKDAVASICLAAGHAVPGAENGPEIVILPESAIGGLHDAVVARSPDLVALGTHGRRGLANLFVGSVAETLLEDLTCDVLVARAPARAPQERVL